VTIQNRIIFASVLKGTEHSSMIDKAVHGLSMMMTMLLLISLLLK
jgi:hypothetical protein